MPVDIAVDRDGILRVVGDGGIARFDGARFVTEIAERIRPEPGRFIFAKVANGSLRVNLADSGAFEVQQLAPTAAPVSISGRVLTPKNRGLVKAVVTLADASGQSRSTTTGVSRYFRFDDVNAGETVIITIESKRSDFAPQMLNVSGDVGDLNFTAENDRRRKRLRRVFFQFDRRII